MTPGVEKDIQCLYFLPALRSKIGGIAFKYMREIGSQPIDLIGPESMHVILRYQGAFPLLDPGELYFLMTMKMRIEIGQYIFLHDDCFIVWNRDRELQYFHIPNIRILQILSPKGQNEEKIG